MSAIVLVTGANGFIGQPLCQALMATGYDVRAAVRSTMAHRQLPSGVEVACVGDIHESTDWTAALQGVSVVIHLAAHVHTFDRRIRNDFLFHRVNGLGTLRLGECAAKAGVRRFVFVSSIRVNGERTNKHPFRPGDRPTPQCAYGRSKYLAECHVREICETTGMEPVIVRPPLVYGPGVKANFLRLLKLVARALPLPFGRTNNRRSFAGLTNIVDFLVHCVQRRSAVGETLLMSDGEDLSTAELIRRLAGHLNVRLHLLPIPVTLLSLAGVLTGRTGMIHRLCDDLIVDARETFSVLRWRPIRSVDEELHKTTQWFLSRH